MQTKPCCTAIDGFFKTIFIGFIIALFFAGCRKGVEPVLENEQISNNPSVVAFAKLHLPAQDFHAVSWRSLKPIILKDTVFAWVANQAKTQEQETASIFITATNGKPVEIIKINIVPVGDRQGNFSFKEKRYLADSELAMTLGESDTHSGGNENRQRLIALPVCPTCKKDHGDINPCVLVLGSKKEKKQVFIRATHLEGNYAYHIITCMPNMNIFRQLAIAMEGHTEVDWMHP